MYNVTSVDKIVKVPMLRIACRENDSPSWEKDATEGDYVVVRFGFWFNFDFPLFDIHILA